MNIIDLASLIKTKINEDVSPLSVSPLIYHPDNLEREVSFALLGTAISPTGSRGLYKRFEITVKDLGEHKI